MALMKYFVKISGAVMPPTFEAACQRNDSSKVHELLSETPPLDVNIRNKKGETGLIIAALHDAMDVLKVLISKNADLTIEDLHGQTAMHYAAAKENTEMGIKLVEAKKDNLHMELFWPLIHLGAKKGIHFK